MSESPIAWPSLPKIVQPLVRRHAEDAAFYWTQLDGASQATGLNAQRLIHFQRLLEAHLEGLRVAGIDGMPLTQEALVRWRKPGRPSRHVLPRCRYPAALKRGLMRSSRC